MSVRPVRHAALEARLRAELPELAEAMIPPLDEPTLRASGPSISETSPADRRRRAPLLVALAAVVALAGGGLLAIDLGEEPGSDVAAEAPLDFGTWTVIADSPIPPRPHAVSAWTGEVAVFWAGSSLERDFAHSDGAVYDPVDDQWEPMVVPGWGHPGLTSAFFDGELFALAKGGGTRFDPIVTEWNDLPEVDGLVLAATVASDDAVWGLGPTTINPEGQPDLAIVRYEPDTDTWSDPSVFEGTDAQAEIVNGVGRFESTVMWTGSEIVIWRGPHGGVAYDPENDEWSAIDPPSAPSGLVRDGLAVATDTGLAVLFEVEGSSGTAIDVAMLEESGWRWLETQIPIAGIDTLTAAGAGEWLLAFSPSYAPVVIHLPSGAWQRAETAPIGGVEAPNLVWTGVQLIVWGGVSAGPDQPDGVRWTAP